jgi:hypothetical protein
MGGGSGAAGAFATTRLKFCSTSAWTASNILTPGVSFGVRRPDHRYDKARPPLPRCHSARRRRGPLDQSSLISRHAYRSCTTNLNALYGSNLWLLPPETNASSCSVSSRDGSRTCLLVAPVFLFALVMILAPAFFVERPETMLCVLASPTACPRPCWRNSCCRRRNCAAPSPRHRGLTSLCIVELADPLAYVCGVGGGIGMLGVVPPVT